MRNKKAVSGSSQKKKKPEELLNEEVEDVMKKEGLDREQAYKIVKERVEDRLTWDQAMAVSVTPEEREEAIRYLEDPSLLNHILELFSIDHILDTKQKMFVFLSALSSQLPKQYRFSSAIIGDSSEGKTHLWNTIAQHLPRTWFESFTRITGAAMEDDIRDVNLVYFGEINANVQAVEQIKQFVEDGMHVLKKDARTDFKEVRREKQERKVGVFSTTATIADEELNNRFCLVSVHGDAEKYGVVNRYYMDKIACSYEEQLAQKKRSNGHSWLYHALLCLEPVDFVIIPDHIIKHIHVCSKQSRSQRDMKRFLNLVCVIAWLHQRKRLVYTTEEDDVVLYVNEEDVENADIIGKEIFDQSLSGLEPRLQDVVKAYNKIVKETGDLMREAVYNAPEGYQWIDRMVIQNELNICRDSLKARIKELENRTIFVSHFAGNRVYIALNIDKETGNLPTIDPLITYDLPTMGVVGEGGSPTMSILGGSQVNRRWIVGKSNLFSPVEKAHLRFFQKYTSAHARFRRERNEEGGNISEKSQVSNLPIDTSTPNLKEKIQNLKQLIKNKPENNFDDVMQIVNEYEFEKLLAHGILIELYLGKTIIMGKEA